MSRTEAYNVSLKKSQITLNKFKESQSVIQLKKDIQSTLLPYVAAYDATYFNCYDDFCESCKWRFYHLYHAKNKTFNGAIKNMLKCNCIKKRSISFVGHLYEVAVNVAELMPITPHFGATRKSGIKVPGYYYANGSHVPHFFTKDKTLREFSDTIPNNDKSYLGLFETAVNESIKSVTDIIDKLNTIKIYDLPSFETMDTYSNIVGDVQTDVIDTFYTMWSWLTSMNTDCKYDDVPLSIVKLEPLVLQCQVSIEQLKQFIHVYQCGLTFCNKETPQRFPEVYEEIKFYNYDTNGSSSTVPINDTMDNVNIESTITKPREPLHLDLPCLSDFTEKMSFSYPPPPSVTTDISDDFSLHFASQNNSEIGNNFTQSSVSDDESESSSTTYALAESYDNQDLPFHVQYQLDTGDIGHIL